VSKASNEGKLDEFLNVEVRFNGLVQLDPRLAAELRTNQQSAL
jgi:hypothetical protein